MSDSSDDFLSRPLTDSSASSGIDAELSGESLSSEKSIASTSDHATVTPASQRKRQRKQATPAKDDVAILREIQQLQESTENVIPKQAFGRCVLYPASYWPSLNGHSITVCSLARELLSENGADLYQKDYRITGEAMLALQESAEMYMTQFFEDCNGATAHRGAATLNIRDIAIIQMLRRDR